PVETEAAHASAPPLVSCRKHFVVRRDQRRAEAARSGSCSASIPRARPRPRPANANAATRPAPPQEIEQVYHLLMATSVAKLPQADSLQVCTVCDLFLDYSEKHHAADTYRGYKDFLQDFCELYGTLLGKDVKPLHVSRWLDAHPGWKGSRRNAVVAVKRAFNWADPEGVLPPNPVKSVK